MKGQGVNLALWAAIAVGLILRVAVILQSGPAPRHDLFPGMDEVNYHELAENVRLYGTYAAWTGGFLTRSTRSPGLPVLLAAAQHLTHGHPWTAPLLNLSLDVLNLLLVFLVAQRLHGPLAARLAAALYAVFGPVFLYLPLATPEILSVSLVLLVTLSLLALREHYGRNALALGLLYAFLIHTRPVFLLLVPALALAAWLQLRPADEGHAAARPNLRGMRLLKAAFPAALALLLCLPWGVRNHRLHQAVVPVCVTAGWHLVNRAQTVEDLSVKFLTDYIYDPAHVNFAEGDYYRQGMRLSRDLFWREPLRVLGFGTLRVIHGWLLPSSPWRPLLPRAYVRPVPLGTRGHVVPVPDAEGLLYLLGFCCLATLVWRPRQWLGDASPWLHRALPLLVLLAAYALVHVIGFPLVQYRFTIEPLLLILGSGLALRLLAPLANPKVAPRPPAAAATPTFPGTENLPLACALLLLLAVVVAWTARSPRSPVHYSDATLPHGHLGYPETRQWQWQNLGNLPPDTKAAFVGIVKYSRPGLAFPAGLAVAVPQPGSAVAMLYVQAHDANAPSSLAALGIGDCKLNFPDRHVPKDGQAIAVSGSLTTGAYKDLILKVETWSAIPSNKVP
jgi:4-amino-4-deoxy-L-arabinose transferase-like glycosyltransferase